MKLEIKKIDPSGQCDISHCADKAKFSIGTPIWSIRLCPRCFNKAGREINEQFYKWFKESH